MSLHHRNLVAPVGDPSEDMEYGSYKYVKSDMSNQTVPNKSDAMRKKKVLQEKRQTANRFDMVYKKLGSNLKPEEKRIDYVLVHPVVDLKTITDEDERKEEERKNEIREKFEDAMKEEKLKKQSEVIDGLIYTKIHCPFRRLCEEAETVSLEMPLAGCESEHKDSKNCFNDWIQRHFVTDNEVDMVSAPFQMNRIHLYEKFNDPTNFFRPSLRSLLVEHILINIDLRYTSQTARYRHAQQEANTFCLNCSWIKWTKACRMLLEDYQQDCDVISSQCQVKIPQNWKQHLQNDLNNVEGDQTKNNFQSLKDQFEEGRTVVNCFGCLRRAEDEELGDMQKVGLDYMMLEKVYTNKFILHDESAYNPDDDKKTREALPRTPEVLAKDPRFDLQLTWTRFLKFQPLWKIRNYFGEKIGFYFAWSGTLISTLWLPMLFGFAVFLFGLVSSIQKTMDGTSTAGTSDTSNSTLTDLLVNIKESFDNAVTPFFALFLCVWGTLFLEVWKRRQSELAYQWDVEQFEETEPDRPEFYGTKTRIDPVTNEKEWYYPFARQSWKLLLSTLSLLFMVCLVFVSVIAVIIYRVIATVDYCPNMNASSCMFITTIVSSLLNAISILILGKIYDFMARKLTDWENHRTETRYNDALIIKLFGFQFANNYSSCFYIAFFRGRFDGSGVFNLGDEYTDKCETSCMTQLSFQVLILLLTKPLPKFLTDVILPWGKKQFKKRCQCCSCIPFLRPLLRGSDKPDSEKTLVELESEKPPLGNFTLSEYTEKVIQYGLMMLFAASFPLAPLLVLLTNLFDLRVDAWRMLWWYQRPMAIIAEDIGTWYAILTFLNFCGVVSNAFLIAYTSAWGRTFDSEGKLWLVIFFEHIVFLLKFLLAYLIPDMPQSVAVAIRKKRYQLAKKVEEDYLKNKDLSDINMAEISEDGDQKQDDTGYQLRKPRHNGYPQNTGLEPMYLAREDAGDQSPWRRGRTEDNEDETILRKMRKKKRKNKDDYEDVGQAREPSTDYSGRTSSSIKIKDSRGHDLTEMEVPYR